ncbi:MAG: site-specific integrase [Bacillus sp. (in: Bacteria)]|nr:site-specific integrase [Bacillus sp. (in: firmicutes)]
MEFVQPIRDMEKIKAMKKILKGNNIRDYTLFSIGINSALRIGDLLKLKISDVVNGGGKIKDRITTREQKTGKAKDFPIGATARKAIEEYLKDWKGVNMDDYLFPSRKGENKPITRQHAWYIINEAAREVGIEEKIGTHTLRKTFGYHAYKAGYDIAIIQKLLNHSSPKETLRYIGITQDQLDDVYISLNL